MATSIVCGVDQGDEARKALALARQLSERLGLQLVLAHVTSAPTTAPAPMGGYAVAPYDANASEQTLRAASRFLEDVAVAERLDNVRVRAEIGSAIDWLPRIAAEEQAELLVVGSRGRGPFRAAVLGSVSSALATRASCPVAVVPAGAAAGDGDDALRTIVCGLDDSEGARAALRVADMLASWLGARLLLAHVGAGPHVPGTSPVPGARETLRELELENGSKLLARLAAAENVGTPVEQRVAFGTPGGALADVAEEEDAGLVVVGSRGRGPLKAAVLGSVSAELLASSPCPVVVVPPGLAADVRLDAAARLETERP